MKQLYLTPYTSLLYTLFLFTLFLSYPLHAQTWQWAKSGGTNQPITVSSYGYENALSMTSDPMGNVYFCSNVSFGDLYVDGNAKENFAGPNSSIDGLIASFSCDGSYRWSKVIGSRNDDPIAAVGTDAQGNVYACGNVVPAQYDENDPFYVHFDSDTILPSSYWNVNTYKKSLYLVKYDTDGNLQWLNMPQRDDISFTDAIVGTRSLGLFVEPNGNLHWMCWLPAGEYANGQYVVTEGPSYHILTFGPEGNFTGGKKLDMAMTGAAILYVNMTYHAPSNRYFITGSADMSQGSGMSISMGGEVLGGARYVGAFAYDGTFLWAKTNNTTAGWNNQYSGFAIDETGNLYYSAITYKLTLDPADTNWDGWDGVPLTPDFTPLYGFPFLVKMDTNGNMLWQTCGSTGSPFSLIARDGLVHWGGGGKSLHWGNVDYTYPDPDAQGFRPMYLQFDAATGQALSVNVLVTSGDDRFTSMAFDPNGSLYLGGRFQQSMTVNGQTLNNSGGTTDFFVAKYGTNDCSLSTDDLLADALQAVPNPFENEIHLNNPKQAAFALFDMTGRKVASGEIPVMGTIRAEGLPKGIYVLRVLGDVEMVVKVVRR